jgi:hypothetical protein
MTDEARLPEKITSACEQVTVVKGATAMLSCTPQCAGLVEEIRVRGKVKVLTVQIALTLWYCAERAKQIFPGASELWRQSAFEETLIDDQIHRIRIPHGHSQQFGRINDAFKPTASIGTHTGFPVIQPYLPLQVMVLAEEDTTVDMQVDYSTDPIRARPAGRMMVTIDTSRVPGVTMHDIASELEAFASFLRCERPVQGGGRLLVRGADIGHWELCPPDEKKGRN